MIRRTLTVLRGNIANIQNIRYASSKTLEDQVEKISSATNEGKVIISDSCKNRLNLICDDDQFLRLTVEGGGCSGFTYKFEFDKELKEDDKIFGSDKAKVVIDVTSLEYCDGATIDYHAELIKTGFKVVSNPKAEAGCSCGSSFAMRLD